MIDKRNESMHEFRLIAEQFFHQQKIELLSAQREKKELKKAKLLYHDTSDLVKG